MERCSDCIISVHELVIDAFECYQESIENTGNNCLITYRADLSMIKSFVSEQPAEAQRISHGI